MDKLDSDDRLYIFIIPCIIGAMLIVLANMILPENCYLFNDNTPGPQMCHTIPNDCVYCENKPLAYFSSLIAAIGVGFFFIPIVISGLRNLRKPIPKQPKLFD